MPPRSIRETLSLLPAYAGGIGILFVFRLVDYCKDGLDLLYPDLGNLLLLCGTLPLFFLKPLLFAGVIGRMGGQLSGRSTGFFPNARRYYGRFLLLLVLWYVLAIASMLCWKFSFAGFETGVGSLSLQDRVFAACIGIPMTVLLLAWHSVIVVDNRGLGSSLGRAFRLLRARPAALAIGLALGTVWVASGSYFDGFGVLNGLAFAPVLAIIVAATEVFAYLCVMSMYMHAKAEAFGDEPADAQWHDLTLGAAYGTPSGPGLWLSFLSFLPPMSLVALVVGGLALRKRHSLRAAMPCVLGAFFTILYVTLAIGSFLPRSNASLPEGHAFLAQAEPRLKEAADLLDEERFLEAKLLLEGPLPEEVQVGWPYQCALATTTWYEGRIVEDATGSDAPVLYAKALAQYEAALALGPDRGEFFLLYGERLFIRQFHERAKEVLTQGQALAPGLARLDALAKMMQRPFAPPTETESAISFVIMLLILFSIHEFGHAYAAHKLGDNTAKDAGRLTLNPIAHLDLFGSVILPGLLLWRGSEFLFGWAKPVPVNGQNFRNPVRDHRVVAFAGPAMNFLAVMAGLLVLIFLLFGMRAAAPGVMSYNLANPFGTVYLGCISSADLLAKIITLLQRFILTSLTLGCFNMLPIPPLDGSWIFGSFLPHSLRGVAAKLRPYGMVFFLILIITPALDYILAVPMIAVMIFQYAALGVLGFS